MSKDQTTCTDVEILLDAYYDGELLLSESELVEKHLNACTHCQGHLSDIKRVVASLKGLTPVCLKRDMASEIEWLVKRRRKPKIVTPVVWSSLAVAAAAVLMLVVLRAWLPAVKTPYTVAVPPVSVPGKPPTSVVAKAPSSGEPGFTLEQKAPLRSATHDARRESGRQSRAYEQDSRQLYVTTSEAASDYDAFGLTTTAYIAAGGQASITEVLGLETNEDGLYAIKM